jgi:replicative DNA helicase
MAERQYNEAYNLEDLQKDIETSPPALRTGFEPLDKIISIPNSAITLIAARPSHGKTAFLLNLLLNMLRNYPDMSFIYFTLLEPKKHISLKLINILSGEVLDEKNNVGALERYVREGVTTNAKIESGKELFSKITKSGKLWIIDDCASVDDLDECVTNLNEKHKLGAVFIDYLQKIYNREQNVSRELELQKTSHRILDIAKNLSLPIILGAQLQWDERRTLRLDNFYDVSDVIQDATLILGIYNHAMESAQIMGEKVSENIMGIKLTVLKNRDGVVNESASLKLEPPILRISEAQ